MSWNPGCVRMPDGSTIIYSGPVRIRASRRFSETNSNRPSFTLAISLASHPSPSLPPVDLIMNTAGPSIWYVTIRVLPDGSGTE